LYHRSANVADFSKISAQRSRPRRPDRTALKESEVNFGEINRRESQVDFGEINRPSLIFPKSVLNAPDHADQIEPRSKHPRLISEKSTDVKARLISEKSTDSR
jgi:hypothetical protein